jgi:hypothetical protein
MRAYFAFVGVAFLGLAVYLLGRRLSAQLRGDVVIGQIVGHESRTDDESISYLPIVEFADSRGVVHRFTSVAGGSSRSPAVGATVRVRYLADSPGVAYIQTFLHMWAAPLAFAVLGAAALAVWWRT